MSTTFSPPIVWFDRLFLQRGPLNLSPESEPTRNHYTVTHSSLLLTQTNLERTWHTSRQLFRPDVSVPPSPPFPLPPLPPTVMCLFVSVLGFTGVSLLLFSFSLCHSSWLGLLEDLWPRLRKTSDRYEVRKTLGKCKGLNQFRNDIKSIELNQDKERFVRIDTVINSGRLHGRKYGK